MFIDKTCNILRLTQMDNHHMFIQKYHQRVKCVCDVADTLPDPYIHLNDCSLDSDVTWKNLLKGVASPSPNQP